MSQVRSVVHAQRLHDKSASHRALMISALASGESTIEGLSPGHDVASTSAIMVSLGASRTDEAKVVRIVGPREGLAPTTGELDCGNSGTTMRLLSGIVSEAIRDAVSAFGSGKNEIPLASPATATASRRR